jgi:hypothetical protein
MADLPKNPSERANSACSRSPAGDGFGDGQVGHEVLGGGAVPVLLVGRRVDDVARADLGDLAAAGLHQTLSVGDVEGLADGVGVPGGAGVRREADRADPNA